MLTNNNEVEISNYYYKKNEVYQKSEVDALLNSVSSDIVVVNTLNSDSTVDALSANQGKVLDEKISEKVDKVTGKGLSTNDFTTAEKDKLDSLQNTTVVDNLDSTSTTDALSAGRGRYLNIKIDGVRALIPTVVDNLSSTSTTSALSANQGKVLKDSIDSLPVIEAVNSLSDLPSSSNPKFADYSGKMCYVIEEDQIYIATTTQEEHYGYGSSESLDITNLYEWGPLIIEPVDEIEDENYNPVSSSAVYNYIENILGDIDTWLTS